MGTFGVTIEIGDPQGQRFEAMNALVDTGATYTVVPASLLVRLSVTPYVWDTEERIDASEPTSRTSL